MRASPIFSYRRAMEQRLKMTKPTSVDLHIGRHIRTVRMRYGIEARKMADKLGLLPQQVNKYETGVTRIPASTLFAIAKLLDEPISAFFPSLTVAAAKPDELRRS
jgi:transcriptional regulator with XRE-family HTH domain